MTRLLFYDFYQLMCIFTGHAINTELWIKCLT